MGSVSFNTEGSTKTRGWMDGYIPRISIYLPIYLSILSIGVVLGIEIEGWMES